VEDDTRSSKDGESHPTLNAAPTQSLGRLENAEAPLRFERPFAAKAVERLSADSKAKVDAGFKRLAGESVATEAFVFDFVGAVHPSLPKRVGLLLGGCFEASRGRVDAQSFTEAAAIAHAGETLER
jgi:hypothetical protein